MTEQEFMNRIDGAINDYQEALMDGKEFRDSIMDTMIELAQGQFTPPEFDYNLLAEWFTPSERGKPYAEHYRLSGMALVFSEKLKGKELLINEKKIQDKLLEMGAEISYYRGVAEVHPQKGFWLKPTQKLLTHFDIPTNG